jgi:hypothetical protein
MSIEAMKQALEALDAITDDVDGTGLNTNISFDKSLEAITALRQAIDQAEKQEPVAWMRDDNAIADTHWGKYGPNKVFESDIPLYIRNHTRSQK